VVIAVKITAKVSLVYLTKSTRVLKHDIRSRNTQIMKNTVLQCENDSKDYLSVVYTVQRHNDVNGILFYNSHGPSSEFTV